jgi:hypothetical protein
MLQSFDFCMPGFERYLTDEFISTGTCMVKISEKTEGIFAFTQWPFRCCQSPQICTACAEIFLCLNSSDQLNVERTQQVAFTCPVPVGSIRQDMENCTEKWIQFFRSSENETSWDLVPHEIYEDIMYKLLYFDMVCWPETTGNSSCE